MSNNDNIKCSGGHCNTEVEFHYFESAKVDLKR